MSFFKRYELSRLIAESNESQSFRAVEVATGRTVMLHMLRAGQESLLAGIRSSMRDPDLKSAKQLIEVGEFAGSPYVVTGMLEPFTGLPDWIGTFPEEIPWPAPMPAAPPPPPPPPPPPTPPRPEAGEFTRFFGVKEAPPPAVSKPGEFTRWFGASSEPAPAPEKPPVQDEYDRLFGEPPKPAGISSPRQPSSPGHESGKFTRFFGSSLPAEAIDVEKEQERARQEGLTASGPRPFQPAGEFTRMFGPADAGRMEAAMAANPPPAPFSSSSTNPFGAGPTSPPVPPLQSTPEEISGPGDYSRVIGPPPAAIDTPSPVAPPAPPTAAPRRTWLTVLCVIAPVLVLILFFVLWRMRH